MAKQLPQSITSYDLLKAAAVIIMIIDHIGYYFMPENEWFRAVGRIGFPVWFFLIGYARSRDFSPKLWAGATALLICNLIVGMYVFPLNALWSMIIIRLLLDNIAKAALAGFEQMLGVVIALLILMPNSYEFFEYGTQGLLLAMFGYLIRNRPEVEWVRNKETLLKVFGLLCLAQFVFTQGVLFKFNIAQMLLMCAGLLVTFNYLYYFKPMEFPALSRKLPGFIVAGIEFCGRRTLEIYVGHLILFKFLMMAVDPDRFQWFHPTLMMP